MGAADFKNAIGTMQARCVICHWQLAKNAEEGCVVGNCSFRCDNPTENAVLQSRRAMLSRATAAVESSLSFAIGKDRAVAIACSIINAIESES